MSLEDAVKLIQDVERPRQLRLRAKLNQTYVDKKTRSNVPDIAAAAVCIQKVLLQYVQLFKTKGCFH